MSFSLWPRTIFEKESPMSGLIKVQELFGQHTLSVQNMIQSGGIVRSVWQKPLKKIKVEVKTALILGLGGGTLVYLIKESWPSAKITGIEFDPEIIEVGKDFFDLDEVGDLRIIQANAFDWVKKKKKFDLVLIDLYLGREFPSQGEKKEFLRNIKSLLGKESLAVFNRLRTDKWEEFERNLSQVFGLVDRVQTSTNLFFLVRL